LLLFFAPWASCGGEGVSGANLVATSDFDLKWVAAVPFCAVAVLGILYVLRRQLVVSAWARIVAGVGGLIPLIKLYADARDYVSIQWGSIGTVLGLAGVIGGAIHDLVAGGRKRANTR
jgi:hypothetical protein